MTREEAINILGEVKELDDSIYQYNIKYLEALDMAIKALEKESILDKIRAEIEFEVDHRTNMLCAEDVFEIIDKYKTEGSDKQ